MADFQTLIQNAFVDKALSSTNNWVKIGQITGTGQYANLSLNVVNTSPTSSAIVSLAISNQASLPNTDDIIESNLTLAPNGGTLSRQNIIASVGEYVYVLANTDTVAARMSGIIQALQSMEQLDSEILSLSAQQETHVSSINSLVAQQQKDMANIANLTSQLAQDDQTLQDEINALSTQLSTDNTNLQNQINGLSGQLSSDNTNLQNQINGLSGQLSSDNTNLQNQINGLSKQLASDNSNLQNQINGLSGQLSSDNTNLQNQINGLSGQLASDNSNLQNQINNNQISSLFSNYTRPNRSPGSTYYNLTGKPMFLAITAQTAFETQGGLVQIFLNGDSLYMAQSSGDLGGGTNYYPGEFRYICAIVPNGMSYAVEINAVNIVSWVEIY